MTDYPMLPLESIKIDRPARQRKRIETMDLEESIRTRGVLVPIIVRRDTLELVAGERRWTTCKKLGLDTIPVRFVDECDPLELSTIEFEENVRRMDLTWQDLVAAIKTLHSFGTGQDPEWSLGHLAKRTGYNKDSLREMLLVADNLENPLIAKATGWGAAHNVLVRDRERKQLAAIEELHDVVEGLVPALDMDEEEGGAPQVDSILEILTGDDPQPVDRINAHVAPRSAPRTAPDVIQVGDFIAWAESYRGPKFNLIHCDFPYGIDFNAGAQGGRNDWSGYDDSADTYWRLCEAFCEHLENFASPSAHLVFWFSMNHYSRTLELFSRAAPSWAVNPHPLIWLKSDNVGVLPDPKRGPRRIVETALLASRGDRPVVKPVSNGIAAPTDKELHQSTKPAPVLRHFFSMLVDGTSRVLDPTAGSGSALRVASELGAEAVFGLELNPEHAQAANAAYKRAGALRKASKTVEGK